MVQTPYRGNFTLLIKAIIRNNFTLLVGIIFLIALVLELPKLELSNGNLMYIECLHDSQGFCVYDENTKYIPLSNVIAKNIKTSVLLASIISLPKVIYYLYGYAKEKIVFY